MARNRIGNRCTWQFCLTELSKLNNSNVFLYRLDLIPAALKFVLTTNCTLLILPNRKITFRNLSLTAILLDTILNPKTGVNADKPASG